MIDYTKPAKIDYRHPNRTTAAVATRSPRVLRAGETVNLSELARQRPFATHYRWTPFTI